VCRANGGTNIVTWNGGGGAHRRDLRSVAQAALEPPTITFQAAGGRYASLFGDLGTLYFPVTA
jgi:hypothetical protein